MTDIFTQEFLDFVDKEPFDDHLIFNNIRYNVTVENNKECECPHGHSDSKKYTMTLCNNDSYEGFYEDRNIYFHFDNLEELNSYCSKPIVLNTPTKGIVFSTKVCPICREDKPHYTIKRLSRCKHEFCIECLDKIVKMPREKHKCGLCREQFVID